MASSQVLSATSGLVVAIAVATALVLALALALALVLGLALTLTLTRCYQSSSGLSLWQGDSIANFTFDDARQIRTFDMSRTWHFIHMALFMALHIGPVAACVMVTAFHTYGSVHGTSY